MLVTCLKIFEFIINVVNSLGISDVETELEERVLSISAEDRDMKGAGQGSQSSQSRKPTSAEGRPVGRGDFMFSQHQGATSLGRGRARGVLSALANGNRADSEWKPIPKPHGLNIPRWNAGDQSNLLSDTLYQMKDMWKRNQRNQALTLAKDVFVKAKNPYADVLTLLASFSDIRNTKTYILAFDIAREFDLWIRSRRQSYHGMLNIELQSKAFSLATANETSVSANFLEWLASAFDLARVGYLGVPFCKKLLGANNPKVVYQVC